MLTVFVVLAAALLAALALAAARSDAAAGFADRLAASLARLVEVAFLLAAASGLVLLLVQLAVVLLVSVFSVSVVWLQESTAYLFGAMFLLGAGGVYLRDGHVRVDVLSSRWPDRRRALVELLGVALFVLPVCALIVAVSVPWAAQSWAELERSREPSGLHLVFVLKSFVPAFGVLLAFAGFVRAARFARALRSA